MRPTRLFWTCRNPVAIVWHFSTSASSRKSTRLSALLDTMPKESTHAITMKAQRLKIKEKMQKYPPGTVTMQVLGSGAKGAPRSLYLFTDQSRYLFNCGEGTQRLAHEHKMKLSRLEHIFITRGTWDNVGGLPGVVLTIQDVGVPEITLHGPPGIDKIFTATKRFVVLKNIVVKAAACKKEHVFEDNAIRVTYVPILRNSGDKTSETDSGTEQGSSDDDIDYYAHAIDRTRNPHNNDQAAEELPGKNSDDPVEPDAILRESVMCYAVRLQPKPGSLCLEKCVEAGIKPGPMLGRLKSGEDVVLDDGRIVRSADVTQLPDPGPVFLVIECPDESFLDNLVEEPSLHRYQVGRASAEEMPMLIAHFAPSHIIENPKYKEWMDKFSTSTHHVILNESNSCMGSSAVHRIQHKLNLLEPTVFPLLNDVIASKNSSCPTPNSEISSDVSSTTDLGREFNLARAKTFVNLGLRPRKLLDCNTKVISDPDEYRSEVMSIEGFPAELEKLKAELSSLVTENQKMSTDYPNVLFLGTGSCIPNKTRNTSGILIEISPDKFVLADCGEGTYGQLVRFFGPDDVDRVLRNIKAIYISHLHADHHIGLIGVLKALGRVGNQGPVYLLAPKQIMFWLHMYDRQFEKVLRPIQVVANQELLYNNYQLEESVQNALKDDLGLKMVKTTYVKHCPNAFGVSFEHVDGWKIAYSGDTMPCDELVEIGKDCDLLIHEATMEDELKEEAVIKQHSTTSEAIDIGRRMGAAFTMLTHFSQRYAKLPRFDESGTFGDNVGIAFDNMRVRFRDLAKLKYLHPALRLMFYEDVDELETKAYKRQMKQERELKKKQKI
ncbi:zinc phosphodiesterase [Nesidiocoris tenuis]|uniref:ribonuclease Z n=1 Tax=Nesidiocoris tenuis TaxID=355587 RepID=A0ABN7BFF3_9HEMI|nr:zinc phosphodiesterase [Nesidiocoris tenuis]